VPNGEAENTNFIIICLTYARMEPTSYPIQGDYAYHTRRVCLPYHRDINVE